jgi:hypothetical protein
MGDLADIIRDGLRLIDEITLDGGLQCDVVILRKAPQNFEGTAAPSEITVKALVEYNSTVLHLMDGREIVAKAWIMFVRPQEISPSDRLRLPDGQTGPMYEHNGFADSTTGKGFYREVYLG